MSPMPCAACSLERRKDWRGYNYVVRFPEKILFEGSVEPKEMVWFNVNHEGTPGEALDAAWIYFKAVNQKFAKQQDPRVWYGMVDGFGPLRGPDAAGLVAK